MAEHRIAKQKCPQCKEIKEYEVRRKYCDADCAKAAKAGEVLPAAEEHKLRRENTRLRADLTAAREESAQNRALDGLLAGLSKAPQPKPPAWTVKHRPGVREATPTAFLSDTHYGEVVHPEQIEHLNGYDREIAGSRTRTFFESTVELARDYLKGLNYPGIVLAMGGDMFSGDIHEELARTNAGPIQEEILHWLDPIIAGITMLADEFGKVRVPVVVGNHPRGTMKPSHKMRVPNNFDWLYAHLLAKFMRHDKRVVFEISTSADYNYTVYGTRYRLSHGDQFRGGSGIAGLLSPLMIGDARKRKRAAQTPAGSYDWLLLGHWHQRSTFKNIKVNGSLKGYDEYAYHANFDFQPPEQSFWLTDPSHGITIDAPIHVLGKNESWMKRPA